VTRRPVLATAPITWGVCEIPDWGAELPADRVLDEMAALGFAGTELGRPGYLPEAPGLLRATLRARGLSLVGAFCPLTLYDPEGTAESLRRGEALARFLAEMECPFLIAADAGDERRQAIAGRVGVADGLSADGWSRFGEGLSTLAERVAPLGVRVVLHPHAGTYVETGREIDLAMANTPADAVGLCLDTGHLVYGGSDPLDVCRTYARRVWHVHAKDVRDGVLARMRAERLDYLTAVGEGVFAPLGEGGVDVRALLAELRRVDYGGWIVLEQDVRLGPAWPDEDPLANARRSLDYLRRLLGPAPPASGRPGGS